jgi:hypothetical protein
VANRVYQGLLIVIELPSTHSLSHGRLLIPELLHWGAAQTDIHPHVLLVEVRNLLFCGRLRLRDNSPISFYCIGCINNSIVVKTFLDEFGDFCVIDSLSEKEVSEMCKEAACQADGKCFVQITPNSHFMVSNPLVLPVVSDQASYSGVGGFAFCHHDVSDQFGHLHLHFVGFFIIKMLQHDGPVWIHEPPKTDPTNEANHCIMPSENCSIHIPLIEVSIRRVLVVESCPPRTRSILPELYM